MQQENITNQQSLVIIESMINKAKNQFSEHGHLYLLWGWAVFISSMAQCVLLYVFHSEKHYMVWFSMWLVLIYQIFYLRKERKQKRVKTYTDEIITFVWLVFFILMCLFDFLYAVNFEPDKHYRFIYPSFLVLYGMPTFLCGIILKLRPLIVGAIICWWLSIIASFTSTQFHLLTLPVTMIAAWIIPGYLLRKKFKRQTI